MMHSRPHNPSHDFHQGLLKFNNGDFFQAHEDFEAAWRKTPGEEREFYRSLLQISGGYFRLTQGNVSGARKFFTLALDWLEGFPANFQGTNVQSIRETLQSVLSDLDKGRSPQAILNQRFQPIHFSNPETDR